MDDNHKFGAPKALAAELRDRVGLSAAYASELAAGKRTPSLALAVKIERELQIPASAWIDRETPADQAA
jgi:transcriptional regulator with XRE-family HTH domain